MNEFTLLTNDHPIKLQVIAGKIIKALEHSSSAIILFVFFKQILEYQFKRNFHEILAEFCSVLDLLTIGSTLQIVSNNSAPTIATIAPTYKAKSYFPDRSMIKPVNNGASIPAIVPSVVKIPVIMPAFFWEKTIGMVKNPPIVSVKKPLDADINVTAAPALVAVDPSIKKTPATDNPIIGNNFLPTFCPNFFEAASAK